jgi:hypothetical protein
MDDSLSHAERLASDQQQQDPNTCSTSGRNESESDHTVENPNGTSWPQSNAAYLERESQPSQPDVVTDFTTDNSTGGVGGENTGANDASAEQNIDEDSSHNYSHDSDDPPATVSLSLTADDD